MFVMLERLDSPRILWTKHENDRKQGDQEPKGQGDYFCVALKPFEMTRLLRRD